MSKFSIEEVRKLSNKAAEEVKELFQSCPVSNTSNPGAPTEYILDLIDENAKLKQELAYWKSVAAKYEESLQRIEQAVLK